MEKNCHRELLHLTPLIKTKQLFMLLPQSFIYRLIIGANK
jgi:hypothetical protein